MARGGRAKARSAEPPVRVDLRGFTDGVIGAQAGLTAPEYQWLDGRLREAIVRLEGERREGRRPFLELAGGREALAETERLAAEIRGRIDRCVVVAGEGSSLGVRALVEALAAPIGPAGPGAAVHFVDGADPATLGAVLDGVDLGRTLFHVVTRSNDCVETLAAFLVIRERLLRALGGVEYARHLLLTTDPDAGPLRQIVNDEGLPATEYPSGVAGYQCGSSPRHLLAAMLAGVDVSSFLDGVRAMDERCRAGDPEANPAASLAASHYLLATLHGVQTSVLMIYEDRLAGFAEWWRHLWAATLGKRVAGDGGEVSVGTTPVVARGTLDQYTQLQMYLEGPADKSILFLQAMGSSPTIDVPRSYGDIEEIGFLGGRTLGEMRDLEQSAVRYALARAGRPAASVELPGTTAHALGQAMRLFEVTALLCASLHDVDPQARPGAEFARRLVSAALAKPGCEAERAAWQAWRSAHPQGVVR